MSTALKDMFDKEFIERLSQSILSHYPSFKVESFQKSVFNKEWKNEELKQRMKHIARSLHEFLPANYKETIAILMKVSSDLPSGFEQMIFPDFVEQFGMSNWEISMRALAHFTKLCSSEFAIRPFILQDEDKTMKQMYAWSKNKNVHLRRLASEGCRPRLPWAMALPKYKNDPSIILPILENLITDPEKYVQKSVANNLNDISKDHPELVLELARKWIDRSEPSRWIVKHALRTLLKQGDVKAMRLFDFNHPSFISKLQLNLNSKKYNLNETVEFSIEMHLDKSEKLRLEFGVDYMKSNGSANRKIFQISEKVQPKGSIKVNKKLPLVIRSTRKLYPGIHNIAIIANGVEMANKEFELVF